jgi:hypothetical protein
MMDKGYKLSDSKYAEDNESYVLSFLTWVRKE